MFKNKIKLSINLNAKNTIAIHFPKDRSCRHPDLVLFLDKT